MSGTTQKTSNAQALGQSSAAVERVTRLVRSVLQKYPQHTLAPRLAPFLKHSSFLAVRRSSHADEVVMTEMGAFRNMETFRFPVSLLDAQESEITRWARDRYWEGVREAQKRLRDDALAKTKKARENLARAQADFDRASKILAEIRETPRKARRAREAANSTKPAE